MRDYNFEDQITEGKIQKIENIIFEFHKVSVCFVSLFNGKKKVLTMNDVTSMTMEPGDDESADVMAYETLIGYDHFKKGNLYRVCIRTDTYEISISCYSEPELTDCL